MEAIQREVAQIMVGNISSNQGPIFGEKSLESEEDEGHKIPIASEILVATKL